MTLISDRPLKRGIIIPPGVPFDADTDDTRRLLNSGLARIYETKVIIPEVVPVVAVPFRLSDLPDQTPARMDTEADKRILIADAPVQRASTHRRWGRRGKSAGAR
jgi:hypothetical protein